MAFLGAIRLVMPLVLLVAPVGLLSLVDWMVLGKALVVQVAGMPLVSWAIRVLILGSLLGLVLLGSLLGLVLPVDC